MAILGYNAFSQIMEQGLHSTPLDEPRRLTKHHEHLLVHELCFTLQCPRAKTSARHAFASCEPNAHTLRRQTGVCKLTAAVT